MDIGHFVDFWRNTCASERANKDVFLIELCKVLKVPGPRGTTGDPDKDTCVFEADATIDDGTGKFTFGKIDLYKRGCFILEAKQASAKGSKKRGTARRGTPGWSSAMVEAGLQAKRYAQGVDEPPPFLIVADIGYCFDLYACFDGSGVYAPYHVNHRHRIFFHELPKHIDLLRTIWLTPFSLDPTKLSEKVTQDVAKPLANLAESLEADGHSSDIVARFVLRCVFTMFAEDIGLLPNEVFSKGLEEHWIPNPRLFKEGVEALWDAMNEGKGFYILGKLLRFNGGLFANPKALRLKRSQLRTLHSAAKMEWSEVQPAIFGTLIEKVLDEKERHRLGAHFTPAEYVERLLVPTLEEPLRRRWELVTVRVRQFVPPGESPTARNLKLAQEEVTEFHRELCKVTVLDPACGSGNFLYMALNLFKRLEAEVLGVLDDLGGGQLSLGDSLTVTPQQFKGIEIRRESKEIAELVLWIGYLQWHHKMYGNSRNPPEPVLRDYKNIECRDALLDEAPQPNLRGLKEKRPTRKGAPQAVWPDADYIIGNPPYIGARKIRPALGNDYVDSLRKAYSEVPKTVDLVMYWWHKAATLASTGAIQSFGFITTNSITQQYSRPALELHLGESGNLSLKFAVSDHPWVDSKDGAAVRVAMTVGAQRELVSQAVIGEVEEVKGLDSSSSVLYEHHVSRISSALSDGVSAKDAIALISNEGVCFQGVVPAGNGFKLTEEDLENLKLEPECLPPVVKPYMIGKDIVQKPQKRYIIDFFGLDEQEARRKWPVLYNYLLSQGVRDERARNPRKSYREKWWLFAEPRPAMRKGLANLKRFIGTPNTARFRPFVFVDGQVLPDAMIYAIASDDAGVLGVLSSKVHRAWALMAGGTLEDRPRYNSKLTFFPFPFPENSPASVATIAEELDSFRRKRIEENSSLTLTTIYDLFEKLDLGRTLSSKEHAVFDDNMLATLRGLHSALDVAVMEEYGLPESATDVEIVEFLARLNGERKIEEEAGLVRWLRPSHQQERARIASKQNRNSERGDQRQLRLPWPDELAQQVVSIRDFLAASDVAMAANDVARLYKGASAQAVIPALETLEALGLAASFKSGRQKWKGLVRTSGRRQGTRKSSWPPPSVAANDVPSSDRAAS